MIILSYTEVYSIYKYESVNKIEDLQDTYEFNKNHDYEREKDDFEMEL